jgi:hypothetical protein
MSAAEQKSRPIMLRANITQREWLAIRTRAMRERISNADLVARLIRKGMEHDGR